jgi:hypothetical protein
MKKIMFLFALVVSLTISATAQRATLMPFVAADTLTNTGTVTKTIIFTGGYEGVAIQPVLTKLSGAVAGTIVLYESLDGTNYKSTGDTLTLANATTNTVIWKKTSPIPVYYRTITSGATTVSAVMRTYYVARKHD